MKSSWIGLACVLLAGAALVTYKRVSDTVRSETITSTPSVLLVADSNEAGETADRCAEIINAVRTARKRGVKVAELAPNSSSELLKRYHVVTAPTVVIIAKDGNEAARYEGEEESTVEAIKANLARLSRD